MSIAPNEMTNFQALVIGAGATGTRIANLLTKTYGKRVSVELWDKGRGIGGRMATSRLKQSSQLTCDLGAQYFSITKEYWKKHERYERFFLTCSCVRQL